MLPANSACPTVSRAPGCSPTPQQYSRRAMASPSPFEIIQAPPGQITMVHELNHQIRVIAMDKPMQTYEQLVAFPFYNGHSVGHFEGDTLVVQTNGFNEKTFLDATGAPHTDMLVVTERIRKV